MYSVGRLALLPSSNANISGRPLRKSYSQSLGPKSSAKYYFSPKLYIEQCPEKKSASQYHALSPKPIESYQRSVAKGANSPTIYLLSHYNISLGLDLL